MAIDRLAPDMTVEKFVELVYGDNLQGWQRTALGRMVNLRDNLSQVPRQEAQVAAYRELFGRPDRWPPKVSIFSTPMYDGPSIYEQLAREYTKPAWTATERERLTSLVIWDDYDQVPYGTSPVEDYLAAYRGFSKSGLLTNVLGDYLDRYIAAQSARGTAPQGTPPAGSRLGTPRLGDPSWRSGASVEALGWRLGWAGERENVLRHWMLVVWRLRDGLYPPGVERLRSTQKLYG